jgi:hypothetical protein
MVCSDYQVDRKQWWELANVPLQVRSGQAVTALHLSSPQGALTHDIKFAKKQTYCNEITQFD